MDIPIDLIKDIIHELKKLGSDPLADQLQTLIGIDRCGSCGKSEGKRDPFKCLECACEIDRLWNLKKGWGWLNLSRVAGSSLIEFSDC